MKAAVTIWSVNFIRIGMTLWREEIIYHQRGHKRYSCSQTAGIQDSSQNSGPREGGRREELAILGGWVTEIF